MICACLSCVSRAIGAATIVLTAMVDSKRHIAQEVESRLNMDAAELGECKSKLTFETKCTFNRHVSNDTLSLLSFIAIHPSTATRTPGVLSTGSSNPSPLGVASYASDIISQAQSQGETFYVEKLSKL